LTQIASASLDGLINISKMDGAQPEITTTLHTMRGVNSIDIKDAALLSGHVDGIVRLFDTRSKDSKPTSTFAANSSKANSKSLDLNKVRSPVAGVQWDGDRPYEFMCGTMDSRVRIFDVRKST